MAAHSITLPTFVSRYMHCNLCSCRSRDASQAGHVASAGGQGFADVAVTCLTRAAAPIQQTEDARGPPRSPNLTWQELQGHSMSARNSPEQARTGLLWAAFGAAANALKAIANPGKSGKSTLLMIGTHYM